VSDAYLGATPEWRESLGFARGRILSVLWITTLVGLGVVLAMFAFILPGIWLYVSWSMAVAALLFEDYRGRKALGRSFALVKGRWWQTFGALVVGILLAAVVGGILSGLVSALAFTNLGDSILGAAILNGISSGIAQLVTTPVTIAILTVLYYDLRVRKEGVDLETLTGRLGITPEPGKLPRAAQPVVGWQGAGGPPPTAPGWQAPPAQPQQWEGPPPTGPGWQTPPGGQWQGSGWQQPAPPDEPAAPPPPAPEQPPDEAGDGDDWAPPRPPGAPPER
jgi:hypothetical protein